LFVTDNYWIFEKIMTESVTFTYQNLGIHGNQTGSGKPLLFLHGWGADSNTLLPLAQKLANIRQCTLIDLPGFGKTEMPPHAWSVDNYTDMAEYLINEYFEPPVDLLAHSFGGRMAIKLCSRPDSKQLVDKVLITGGAGMKPKRSSSYYLKKYTAKTLKLPFMVLPSGAQNAALAKLRRTRLWKALGSSDYSKLDGVMRGIFVKTVTDYLEPCLPNIPHEVLLIWGENDGATPLYQGRRMEKGIPNAALVEIPQAGHYAFLDQPKRFEAIARAFFEG
jgi:pimeloyl-ACP methyl ester carboxylesterase